MEKILIITGEHSGEKYGSEIVKSIRNICPYFEFIGSGGEFMEKEGVKLLENVENLSAIGPVEAFKLLGNYLKLLRKIKETVKNEKIKYAILVDFPDFNLFLAPRLKKLGVKIIYFISPTIWIWRYNRVKRIKKYVKLMLSIFPNETEIFKKEGVKSIFVGHPLKKKVEGAKKVNLNEIFNQKSEKIPIALLPGSRKKEIEHIFDEILEGIKLIKEKHPSLFFVIPIANQSVKKLIEKKLLKYKNLEIFTSNLPSFEILKSSHMAIVKSGTSTLEATFSKIPFFVVYKTSKLTYLIGRTLLKIKNIGMVNLIGKEEIVPELVQKECNPKNISKTFLKIYENEKIYYEIREKLNKISDMFGDMDTFLEVGKIFCKLLEEKG